MNIGLVVNANGKMCLVHDELFERPIYWVAYHLEKSQLEIMFYPEGSYLISWNATLAMADYLAGTHSILLIRMEDKQPIEGYDCSLLWVLA